MHRVAWRVIRRSIRKRSFVRPSHNRAAYVFNRRDRTSPRLSTRRVCASLECAANVLQQETPASVVNSSQARNRQRYRCLQASSSLPLHRRLVAFLRAEAADSRCDRSSASAETSRRSGSSEERAASICSMSARQCSSTASTSISLATICAPATPTRTDGSSDR